MIKKSFFLFWMVVLLPITHIAEAQNLNLEWIPQLEVADPLLSTDSLPPVAFGTVPEKRNRRKFSIGLTRSYYKPSLRELNQILANPKRVIIQDPNHRLPTNPEFRSESRNVSMDKIGGDMTLGIEAELHISHRNGLVISFSEWEGETGRTDLIPILLSPGDPAVSVPRQIGYNLKLKQLFLTWRYAFFDLPKRGRLYLDLGFLGMSYATFGPKLLSTSKTTRPVQLSIAVGPWPLRAEALPHEWVWVEKSFSALGFRSL